MAVENPSMGNEPQPDFNYIVQTFFVQVMLNTGAIPNPITQKSERNDKLAKFNITLLELLEAKTSGNLEASEKMILENCLHQARMAVLNLK